MSNLRLLYTETTLYTCVLCIAKRGDRKEMEDHLKLMHNDPESLNFLREMEVRA